MFIDTEITQRQELHRSEMFGATIGLTNIPLLRSCENFIQPGNYKHVVPSGLVLH